MSTSFKIRCYVKVWNWSNFERRKSVKMLFDLPKIIWSHYLLYTMSKTLKYFLIDKSLASLALLQILASLKISLANFINCTASMFPISQNFPGVGADIKKKDKNKKWYIKLFINNIIIQGMYLFYLQLRWWNKHDISSLCIREPNYRRVRTSVALH